MIYSLAIRTSTSTQYISKMLPVVTGEDFCFHMIRRPGVRSPIPGFDTFLTDMSSASALGGVSSASGTVDMRMYVAFPAAITAICCGDIGLPRLYTTYGLRLSCPRFGLRRFILVLSQIESSINLWTGDISLAFLRLLDNVWPGLPNVAHAPGTSQDR
jgi:hypothetical protein